MTTTYTGIDYGLGRSNIDKDTGIRFGVISQNSLCPEAFDDCWTQARDLSYAQAVAEAKQRIASARDIDGLTNILYDLCIRSRDSLANTLETATFPLSVEAAEDIWPYLEDDFNDAYSSMNDCGERDWLYESDGYKLTNCLTSDIMVLASPYFTYAQFCSPCVPGACNLDSPLTTCPRCEGSGTIVTSAYYQCPECEGNGGMPTANRAYCLGHEWFDNGQAPYPVYSVETGLLVSPNQ